MKQDKQKQVEDAYERGLALEKSGNFAAAAAAYYEVLALDKEDCAGVTVRLAAMGLGAVPKTAPPAYIGALFDQYADVFDMILVDSLGYNVPNLLCERISAHYPGRYFKNLLDLGCGTGLVGEAFIALADKKTGVDLSQNMVEIAHEREIYHRLFTGDISRFLREKSRQQQWDLIIAADVLPYIGDLHEFFSLVSRALAKNGVFAFSSENMEKIKPHAGQQGAVNKAEDFTIGPHQRFAHNPAYIDRIIDKAGLKTKYYSDIIVRQEQGEPVSGQIFLTEKL
ncbi:MAG: methyltransferase domain-containing protein [Candidatus Tokpelaia sp.]|uniref:class I SAM-dependent DNA methyltransferase n=1 Tax=Candidatus Tokpelaia sp. TaxID=2233777 RepID=UPI00123B5F56|nr:methyltransferase [Candidatus Tokpelaia sp.]KAA6204802.1 MAG: methyltransferase domain-containing protein [Candidatus Tokpelaia sp.]KAA6207621.1 MAG: methyltransferase domain-containing protein [Candidatus Tokpelaia sp.]KAA6404794.1 S-adenosylmethionine-dependent methyltransferase [Candidatus Tokpelaia sp.]